MRIACKATCSRLAPSVTQAADCRRIESKAPLAFQGIASVGKSYSGVATVSDRKRMFLPKKSRGYVALRRSHVSPDRRGTEPRRAASQERRVQHGCFHVDAASLSGVPRPDHAAGHGAIPQRAGVIAARDLREAGRVGLSSSPRRAMVRADSEALADRW